MSLNRQPSIWQILAIHVFACVPMLTSVAQEADQGASGEVRAVRVETLAAEVNGGSGGIAVDKEGNVYTADFGSRLGPGGTGGDKVFKITPDGTVSQFCSGLRGASGNSFDAHGNLFQSNIGGNLISRITPDGTVSVFSRDGLRNPVGIAIDKDGSLYVGNCGSGSIQKITKDAVSAEFAKSPLLRCPNGVTIDDEGNLYVANFYNGDVIKITPDAAVSRLATVPGNNNGHLVFFRGQLFVVARTANQIYRVTLSGEVSLFAGSGKRGQSDGSALAATFSLPNDIGVSPDGKFMYVNEVAPISGSPQILAPTRVRRIVLAD